MEVTGVVIYHEESFVLRVLACGNANVIQNGIRLKKSGMRLLGYFL